MERQDWRDLKSFFSKKKEPEVVREIRELTDELRILRQKKCFAEEEQKKISEKVESVKSELSGADAVIAALMNEIQATRTLLGEYPALLRDAAARKDALIDDINKCQSGIRTASRNTKNFSAMKGHLERELMDIINEKSVVMKKLRDIERGVTMVQQEAATKLPFLREYDMVLRQLHTVFREMENRMDVSVKFTMKRL